ncbi:hypothetical protein BH10ACT3_BH10ACT3_21080 [soil metagenome]
MGNVPTHSSAGFTAAPRRGHWLLSYQRAWLRPDVIAGLTVAAIAIPESLGYAVIVGLPPQTGLYCAVLPALVFALVGSTRRLVVGADSATAAMVAAGAVTVAAQGSPDYATAVGALALLTALVLLVMALARLGFLADLVSRPVLVGLLAGIGVSLIASKLPVMLGLSSSGSTLRHLRDTFEHLGQINWWTVAVSVPVVVIMMVIERWLPRIPAALIAMAAATLFSVAIARRPTASPWSAR